MKILAEVEINGADFVDDLNRSARLSGESIHDFKPSQLYRHEATK